MLVKEVDRPAAAAASPAPQLMRGARILLEALVREGVDTVFGYPGGAVLHIYDEVAKMGPRLRHVLARHEQGAVHMAEGYRKSTWTHGVVLATCSECWPTTVRCSMAVAASFHREHPRNCSRWLTRFISR